MDTKILLTIGITVISVTLISLTIKFVFNIRRNKINVNNQEGFINNNFENSKVRINNHINDQEKKKG